MVNFDFPVVLFKFKRQAEVMPRVARAIRVFLAFQSPYCGCIFFLGVSTMENGFVVVSATWEDDHRTQDTNI